MIEGNGVDRLIVSAKNRALSSFATPPRAVANAPKADSSIFTPDSEQMPDS